MIDAALALAAKGVAVFPVGEDKAPRTPRGFYDATTDEAVIRSWNWADAMIGSPPKEGVVIIDVDPRNGGEMTLGLFPALPPTRTTKTRSGGRHYWLTVSPDLKLRGTMGPGVDVKRAGKGYVVIPPSPGYVYVRGGEMAPAPDWLLEELVQVDRAPDTAASPKFFPFQTGTPYGEAALRNALQEIRDAGQGTRHETLNRVAFGMGQLAAGGELDTDAACESLLHEALESGLDERDAYDVLRRGWFAGERSPRQAPKALA